MSIANSFLDAIAPLLDSEEALKELQHAAQQPLQKSISLVTQRWHNDALPHDTEDPENIRNCESIEEKRKLSTHDTLALRDQYYVDRLQRDIPLGKTWQHLCGFFYIQELAAGLPAHIVDIPPGAMILDMCAAPGGKSVQLANRLLQHTAHNAFPSNSDHTGKHKEVGPGLVWANDMNGKRLATRASNIQRTGMYNAVATRMDGSAFGNLLPEFFDTIVADVPCSGEGTYYKSASALDWRNHSDIMQLQHTQKHLFISALKALKVGGSLVYSTCTLNHWENEMMIADILQEYGHACQVEHIHIPGAESGCTHYGKEQILPQTVADKLLRCRPHKQKTGGFFVSKRRKTDSIRTGSHKKIQQASYKRTQSKQNSRIQHSSALSSEVSAYLENTFGIHINHTQHAFVSYGKYIYVCSPSVLPFVSEHPRYHIGLPILKPIRDGFVPTHHVGQLRGGQATTNTMEVSCDRLQSYTQHQELSVPPEYQHAQGYHIITCKKQGVSVTKIHRGRCKNKFIKR